MLTERVEDYLEAIYGIHRSKGYVRVKDIANALGVQYSSVTEMMKKLKTLRLVHYEKYGGIVLTGEGEEIGRSVKDRHDTLCRLLTIAGVPAELVRKGRLCHGAPPEPRVHRTAQEAGQRPGDRRGRPGCWASISVRRAGRAPNIVRIGGT